MFTRIFLLMVLSFGCLHNSYGQIVLKREDTTYNKWRDAVFLIKSIYGDKKSSISDTLSGTGFLVNDGNRYYMITTKHVVQADIYKKNQKLINNKFFIKPPVKSGLSFDLSQPQNSAANTYLLSSDDEDIAVISLQNKKEVIDHLLGGGCRPLNIQLFDNNSFSFKTGETVLTSSYKIWYYQGKESLSFGLSIDTIAESASAKFVTINGRKLKGSDGALVMGDNKLIGMITRKTNQKTNKDIIKNPNYIAHSATLVKTAYILHMIDELKAIEK